MSLIQMDLMQMSLAASLLIVGIVLFRSLMIHRIPKKVMVLLWEIALLRLLVPVILPLPFPVPGFCSMVTDYVRTESLEGEFGSVSVTKIAEQSPKVAGEREALAVYAIEKEVLMDWKLILTVLYLTGVSVMALGSLYLYMRDSRLFQESLPMPDPERERILGRMGTAGEEWKELAGINFRVSDRTATPVVYGILHPAVIFPKEVIRRQMTEKEDASGLEKESVFCLWHELAHIQNHDNLRKIVLHGVLCLHWFNPLVWVMYFLFNRDMELLCDEMAVRRCRADKKEYAMALLSLAEWRAAGFRTVAGFGKNAVKERILAVMSARRIKWTGMLAAAGALVIATTVFFPGQASAKSAAEEYADNTAEAYTVYAYDTETAATTVAEQTYYGGTGAHSYTGNRADSTERASNTGVSEHVSYTVMAAVDVQEDTAENVYVETTEDLQNFDSEEVWEEETASDSLILSVRNLAEEFAAYGLSAESRGDDYQLYFEGEPVYFFADNQSGDEKSFSGRVFAREAGILNGDTGVVTVRNEEGEITGLKRLSREESADFAGIWTGGRKK